MNNAGVVQWIKEMTSMNTTLADTVPTIAVNSSGTIYVAYQTTGVVLGGTNIGSTDIAVFKIIQIPDAPTAVYATAGNALATVVFTAPTVTGGYDIISYTVTSSSGAVVTGSASPITVSDLINGTAYTFTVTATNAVGVSSPSSASASMTPAAAPDPPTNVVGSSPGFNTVYVTWDAPNSSGATALQNYLVKVLPIQLMVVVPAANTNVTIVGLNARTYTFTVTAVNETNTSATSVKSDPVGVDDDTSTYRYMVLNTPFTFKVFSAFKIV
jgi:hypothetical protein